MKSLIVIPARLQSTRLARKMLLDATGKTLIEHTCNSAAQSSLAAEVIVATDDAEIFSAVESFSGNVEMTSVEHQSGTDRVAEVASRHPDYDIVVNVQGDEPEIPGAAIDLAISILRDNPSAKLATLATPIRERQLLDDPSCVKVVMDQDSKALYFSRSPIPHPRNWRDDMLTSDPPQFFQHVGLYAYRREFLLEFSDLPPAPMEAVESLEQLRVLHAGHEIWVGKIDQPIIGIDTQDDYQLFVSRYQNG